PRAAAGYSAPGRWASAGPWSRRRSPSWRSPGTPSTCVRCRTARDRSPVPICVTSPSRPTWPPRWPPSPSRTEQVVFSESGSLRILLRREPLSLDTERGARYWAPCGAIRESQGTHGAVRFAVGEQQSPAVAGGDRLGDPEPEPVAGPDVTVAAEVAPKLAGRAEAGAGVADADLDR